MQIAVRHNTNKYPVMKKIIASTTSFVVLISGAASVRQAVAFQPAASSYAPAARSINKLVSWKTSLSSTAIDEIPSDAPITDTDSDNSSKYSDPEAVLQSRNRLIALCRTLTDNSATGKFITRPADKNKFQQAITDLEAISSSSGPTIHDRDMLLGDWTLIATANLPSSDIRRRMNEKKEQNDSSSGSGKKKKGWFNIPKGRSGLSTATSLNPIQKSIQKSFEVTQRIRNDGTSSSSDGRINRVDNVIEYTPIDSLEDILPEESPLSNIFGKLNVNPLQVKNSKVVLIHNAEVESVSPILRTKIAWVSSVLNVAGTSQFFEEDGADVFGLNNLFGEFLNVGSFDTPYVDEDIRVSRSTNGPLLEQLRVFVRSGSKVLSDNDEMLDSLTAEMRVEEEIEVANSSIESQMKTVTDAAETVREKVTDVLSEAMDDVVERVQDAVESDLEEIGKAVEDVQSGGDVIDAVSSAGEAVLKIQEDVGNAVVEDVSDVVEKLQEVVLGDDDASDDDKKEEKEENGDDEDKEE
jgi:hypothetical protein